MSGRKHPLDGLNWTPLEPGEIMLTDGRIVRNETPETDAHPAPDVTAGDALREAIRRLLFWGVDTGKAAEAADAVLALPELRALIAERDELRATVARVRELLRLRGSASWTENLAIRRALDGPALATHRPRSDDGGRRVHGDPGGLQGDSEAQR